MNKIVSLRGILSAICFCAIVLAFSCVSNAGERVVVVGDSITGHSMNLPYGFTHEIRKALKDANSDVEFVPLGGSGQTIFSWRQIIANSYDNRQRLDIPDIYVKDEFDKGADVLLVHLGMNDALQPSIKYTEQGFESWHKEYVALVNDLRKRVPNVKKIILTPPTMLTENPFEFKNVFMDRMGTILADVAKETNCEFADVRAEFKRHFAAARLLDPKFRITLDFVHPNQYGHQIMSWAFLNAIGEKKIAETYYQEKVDPAIRNFDAAGISLFVVDVPLTNGAPALDSVPVEIKGSIRGAAVEELKVVSCGNLKVDNIESSDSNNFTVRLSGATSAMPTEVVVQSGDLKQSVLVNAPYFVTTGFAFESYPRPEDFPRDKAQTDIDKVTLEGKNPLNEKFADPNDPSKELFWYCYYPTADKTGAENPNAVDIADLAPANAFDAAYVVRFVVSPSDQKATLALNSEGFSTTAIEKIYLNGKEIYFDCLSPRHIKAKDSVEVQLQKGLNILVSRVDHTNWQWGTSFSFENAEGLSF